MFGFGAVMKNKGKVEERLEQSEKANEIISKQRDVSVRSSDDANSVWEDLRNRK